MSDLKKIEKLETDPDFIQWKYEANQHYNISGYKKYRKLVRKNKDYKEYEQLWADVCLTPLIDFMGDENVWWCNVPGVILIHTKKADPFKINYSHPEAYFSGAHWTSRKAGTIEVFDPYDEYQIFGTNQFCQTFAMMYLTDSLPYELPYKKGSMDKYYEYTKYAVYYIKNVIASCKSVIEKKYFSELDYALNQCLNNPNMCVNILEIAWELVPMK
jgi:hypothetical protein